MKPQYVAIFHANLNYAYLTPEKYERTIRASYETIIDTFTKHPDQRYVFEASGFTIDTMAALTPDVLAKLKAAIATGQCEFMGAPYSHPIMANIPEEDAYWSCEFAMRAFVKHLGFRPESFWNPECTWMQYVPRAFAKAGVKYLTLDFESYMVCNDKDYSWVERNRTHDMNWGGHLPWYPLDPNCPALHQPFRDVVPGMDGLCRSDRLVGKYIGYFLGRTSLPDFIANVKQWTGDGNKGATVIIADDAEYCGTSGYFFVKYYRDYTKCFDVDPQAGEKLDALINAIREFGQLVTFKEACQAEPVAEPFFVEDRFAWHRTFADAWAGTPEARHWDPILSELRQEYKMYVQPITEGGTHPELQELTDAFWLHMTNSSNSDGRWPPPPAETCQFNRDWVESEIADTRQVLAELRDLVKDLPLPMANEEDVAVATGYDFHFTDKPFADPADIPHLNNYEIQHAIYYYNSFVDSKEPEKIASGKIMLRAIFDELDRRGMKGIRHWAAEPGA